MLKKESGFTMVELLITMVVFVFVMVAASQIFSGLLTQFKQQSKISETNIEGLVGLEMLRQDLEHLGYGLPWTVGVTYSESSTNNPSGLSSPALSTINDSPLAPRAVISGNDVTYGGDNSIFTGSDYLVIKAVNVALNDASQRWTTLKNATLFPPPNNLRQWIPASENLEPKDRVIVISPGSSDDNARRLVVVGGEFYTTFDNITSSGWPPDDNTETRLVYGINNADDPDNPQRPFNRADFFISRVNNIVPQRCAPNTGVLVKAVLNHGGAYDNVLPLLDCVADMQIIYALDMNEDGTIGTCSNADGSTIYKGSLLCPGENNITGTPITIANVQETIGNAAFLRRRLGEVRVFILAHEGQRDVNYTYQTNSIIVGEFGLGRIFNLTTITDWQDYRWKIYSISVNPINLLR
jgi:prepilin-type N-terminal cleavage/methylation domain-containing protein